jgi:hypothetical protein
MADRQWWEVGSVAGSAIATIVLAIFAGASVCGQLREQNTGSAERPRDMANEVRAEPRAATSCNRVLHSPPSRLRLGDLREPPRDRLYESRTSGRQSCQVPHQVTWR